MKYIVLVFLIIGTIAMAKSQSIQLLNNDSTDFYYKIPEYPEKYSSGNVAARVVDGLGFRYYWATQGLRPEDLAHKPSDEARTTNETLDHLYSLTIIVYNSVSGNENRANPESKNWSFDEKRAQTLESIKQTSELLKNSSEEDFASYNSTLGKSEFPFWNMLNGPIADALWHVGQIVSFRRSSGNPLNSNASMLRGKLRN